MARPNEFSHATQVAALARQRGKCASCRTQIFHLGQAGREGAQAHHVRHIKFGGTDRLDNCVIICQACHYSVHEGGNYRHGTVIGRKEDFPYFNG